MYQNIHTRNALEYVPQSQYISLTEENKLYPQHRSREEKKKVGGGPWKEWMYISFIFTIWKGDGKKTNLLKFKLLALVTET